jgi:hypothetical protein
MYKQLKRRVENYSIILKFDLENFLATTKEISKLSSVYMCTSFETGSIISPSAVIKAKVNKPTKSQISNLVQ